MSDDIIMRQRQIMDGERSIFHPIEEMSMHTCLLLTIRGITYHIPEFQYTRLVHCGFSINTVHCVIFRGRSEATSRSPGIVHAVPARDPRLHLYG